MHKVQAIATHLVVLQAKPPNLSLRSSMTSVVPVRFSGYAGFHSACIDRVLWGQVQDVGVLAEHCFRFCDSLSGKAKTFSKQVLRRTDQIVIGLNPTRATCSFSSTGSCHWI